MSAVKLEATILMRFSAVRQVGLFFGAAYSTAECSWQACGISARHCLASTFGGHTRSSPIILLLLGYSRSTLSNLHLRTDAVLFTNLARLFSSIRFTIALGRVIIHFSVAKLVCSWVRLKALVNGVASQIFLYRACGFDGLR